MNMIKNNKLEDIISFLYDNNYRLLNTAKGIDFEGNNSEYTRLEDQAKLYILVNQDTKSSIELSVTKDKEVFSANLLLEGFIKYNIAANENDVINQIQENQKIRKFKKEFLIEEEFCTSVGHSSQIKDGKVNVVYSVNLLEMEKNDLMLKELTRLTSVKSFIPTGLDKVLSMSNLSPLAERMFGINESAKKRYKLLTENFIEPLINIEEINNKKIQKRTI